MAANSLSGIISTDGAKAALQFQDDVQKRYGAGAQSASPSGCPGQRKWTSIPKSDWTRRGAPETAAAAIPITDLQRRRIGEESVTIDRNSPMHPRLMFIKGAAIQLEKDDIKEQLKAIFEGKDPAIELVRILREPDLQLQFEDAKDVNTALVEGMRSLISDSDSDEKDAIFTHLSELSLYPDAHPFLFDLGKEMEGRLLLCKHMVSLQNEKGVLAESLQSFVALLMKDGTQDLTTFGRADGLPECLCGEAIKQLLSEQIECVKQSVIKQIGDSSKEIAHVAESVFAQILHILKGTPALVSLLNAGCIDPIREHCAEAHVDGVDELVQRWVSNMLVLRGILPSLTALIKDESPASRAKRIASIQMIQVWVSAGNRQWRETLQSFTTAQPDTEQ